MSQDSKHLARVDVLRAAAVLLVFFSHFQSVVFGTRAWSWDGLWWRWADNPSFLEMIPRLYFAGATGVSLFFVISGLCIRLSHLSAPEFKLGHFYWRRAWRIYPPYLLCLGFWVLAQAHFDWKDIGAHLFLVHNFSPEYHTTINAPFWSLAPEAQVYLLYPVLLALHDRWGVYRTGFFFAVLSALSFVMGGSAMRQALGLPAWFEAVRQLPTILWFTWYLGFLVANRMASGKGPSTVHRIVLAFCIVVALPLTSVCRPLFVLRSVVEGIVLSLLAYEYLSMPPLRTVWAGAAVRILTILGLCSYSFYLWHYPVMIALQTQLSGYAWYRNLSGVAGYWVPVAILLGVNVALAYALYVLVERPTQDYGKRLYKRRHPRAIPIPVEATIQRPFDGR